MPLSRVQTEGPPDRGARRCRKVTRGYPACCVGIEYWDRWKLKLGDEVHVEEAVEFHTGD